jgi:O-glycosyl hydrolase
MRIMARVVVPFVLAMLVFQTSRAATATFDGGVTYQTIDGFGANINHRGWKNDELKPVIDAVVDQAGMTLFRLVYDKTDWEATNDNANAYVMNWDSYNQIYSSPDFQKMWDMAAYFNQKGIRNGLMFNFQGNGPAWLGRPALHTGMEAEWAEMVSSLLIYARQTNHLQFGLVGPDNEMDQTPQGVNMTASQYATALRELSQLLDTNGLSDLRFVGPDMSVGGTTYLPEMLDDPVVMSKVAHFGMHGYSGGGAGSEGVYNYLQSTDYPDRNFWMTECGAWCAACDAGLPGTYDWGFCKDTMEYLMEHLLNNASAAIVWEVYDSQYNYYNPLQWSFWGLFGVDDTNAAVKTYTPRKTYYTLAQLSRFVRPGAQRIRVSSSTGAFSPLLAFKHEALSQLTIVGINTSGSSATLSGTLASLPAVPYLDLYYTSASTNLAYAGTIAVTNSAFSATIPADCVFTLASFSRVSAAIAHPRGAPGSVVISWPSSAMGWRLQQSDNLSFPTWTNRTEVPVVDVTNASVTLGLLPGNTFFRLVKP